MVTLKRMILNVSWTQFKFNFFFCHLASCSILTLTDVHSGPMEYVKKSKHLIKSKSKQLFLLRKIGKTISII